MNVITTNPALADCCQRLSQHAYLTVDTEFMRETTFWPKLCLIQMASPDEAVLIDPLAPGLDLEPFFALMRNAAVTKVFHAARQDVEIVWHLGRCLPHPMFDTQVAAMVCGYGDSVSYEQLANDLAKARIDKSSRFTDWAKRPLSEQQLTYAISDVTHLRAVYEGLAAELKATGRTSWLDEEMAILESPATYDVPPENAWLRLRGRIRKPREAAVLKEVAAWREREARSRDVPRSRVLKDDALIDLAVRAPKTPEAMAELRALPNGFERSRAGAELLQAVQTAQTLDPKELPILEKPKIRGANGATIELLKVLLRLVAEEERVAPKIIATVDDLEEIAADDEADVPALKGWRRALFGDKALALKAGHLVLLLERGKVVARPA